MSFLPIFKTDAALAGVGATLFIEAGNGTGNVLASANSACVFYPDELSLVWDVSL